MPYSDPIRKREYERNYAKLHPEKMREYKKKSRLNARRKLDLRWKNEFIGCARHPDSRCNRSLYIHNQTRRCAKCLAKRPSYQRLYDEYVHSEGRREQKRWWERGRNRYLKIQENKI
jgi:hypothetical protein